jgi:hypothetical protein
MRTRQRCSAGGAGHMLTADGQLMSNFAFSLYHSHPIAASHHFSMFQTQKAACVHVSVAFKAFVERRRIDRRRRHQGHEAIEAADVG